MKKYEALKIAKNAVGMPVGGGTSWQIYGPYRSNDLSGPSTSVNYDNYWRARAKRTEWVCHIALTLMGYDQCDADSAIQKSIERGNTTIKDVFDYSLEVI